MKKILIAFSFVLVSCSGGNNLQPNEKIVLVADKMVDCFGMVPMQCLQVRENENEEWRNFYSTIQGFEYKEGTNYTLKIREEKIQNPPADSSSIKWSLVEILTGK